MAQKKEDEELRVGVRTAFDLASSGYDRSPLRAFREGAARLVEFAMVRRGDSVLDAGTGTGWVALVAATKVTPEGRVVGIDLSPRMIAQAKEKARRMRLSNVTFRVGDAQQTPYPVDTFDKVLAAQAIFFMPDPLRALREWSRVLTPGGCIAMACWGRTAFQPMLKMCHELIERYGVRLPPEPDYTFGTVKECRRYLRVAGLHDINSSVVELGYPLPNAEAWWTILWNAGQRGTVRRIPLEDLRRFRRDHLREVESLREHDGIPLLLPAILTAGRKPEAP